MDVLVVSGIFGALAAQKATTAIPIVFLGVADPVGQGIVASLARPGGNLTGTSLALGEGIAEKYIELLKEAVPKVVQIAVLWNSIVFEEIGADCGALLCEDALVPFYTRHDWQGLACPATMAQPGADVLWPERMMILPRQDVVWRPRKVDLCGLPF